MRVLIHQVGKYHFLFQVLTYENYPTRYYLWYYFNKDHLVTRMYDYDWEFEIDDLNLITKFHNAARWLNSDKVKKYFQERIKFYNEKDSLFE